MPRSWAMAWPSSMSMGLSSATFRSACKEHTLWKTVWSIRTNLYSLVRATTCSMPWAFGGNPPRSTALVIPAAGAPSRHFWGGRGPSGWHQTQANHAAFRFSAAAAPKFRWLPPHAHAADLLMSPSHSSRLLVPGGCSRLLAVASGEFWRPWAAAGRHCLARLACSVPLSSVSL